MIGAAAEASLALCNDVVAAAIGRTSLDGPRLCVMRSVSAESPASFQLLQTFKTKEGKRIGKDKETIFRSRPAIAAPIASTSLVVAILAPVSWLTCASQSRHMSSTTHYSK